MYDGAAVMLGSLPGVETLITQGYPDTPPSLKQVNKYIHRLISLLMSIAANSLQIKRWFSIWPIILCCEYYNPDKYEF